MLVLKEHTTPCETSKASMRPYVGPSPNLMAPLDPAFKAVPIISALNGLRL